MKKQLLIASLTIASLVSVAQNKIVKTIKQNTLAKSSVALPPSAYYSFSTFTAGYTSITGSVVSGGQKWDELIYQIPIGFNFTLYNSVNDTINFGGGALLSFNDLNNDQFITAAGPMFEDLCDRAFDPAVDTDGDPGGISPITYTTVGTPGSRICKIEINNGGFYSEISNNAVSTSFVNLQAWLYETTNDIEFRFGTCSIANAADCFYDPNGFGCNLFDLLDVNTANSSNSNALNGPFASPTMVVLSPSITDVLTGTIQSGRVHKFTKSATTAIKNISQTSNLSLYPNPTKDKLYISNISADLNNATIEFYDVTGKQIHSEKIKSEINLSSFEKGIYLVKIKTESGQRIFLNKIVVTE
ncbi:MAG: T9SS type A sorting domain-containing protein [Bacteroidia bacterium]